jgi:hypothetical protein
MKTIEHDIVHAFVILFGMIALFLCTQFYWMDTPGDIYLKEAEKKMGVDYSEFSEQERSFMEQVYASAGGTSIWMKAEFPYVWNFKLAYPLVALFLCGLFALIRGFGIAKLQWKWVFIAVTAPYSILFLTLALELLRGCQPLKGMWLGIIGGALIVFGTFMTKPNPEPAGSGQPM